MRGFTHYKLTPSMYCSCRVNIFSMITNSVLYNKAATWWMYYWDSFWNEK